MIFSQSVTEIVKIADIAAKQTDRWLFLATLILLILYFIWDRREMLKDRKEIAGEHKEDRLQYQASITKMLGDSHILSTAVAVALDRNTEALRVNTKVLEKDL